MIEDLTKHPGWDVLVDWLYHRMKPVKENILNGRVKDRETYISETGYLKGIHEVLDAVTKTAKLVENEHERRELAKQRD